MMEKKNSVVVYGPKRVVNLYLPAILVDRAKLRTDNLSGLVEELLSIWLEIGGGQGKALEAEQKVKEIEQRLEMLEVERKKLEGELAKAREELLKAVEEEHKRLAEQLKLKELQPWINQWRQMKQKPNLFTEEYKQKWLEDSAKRLKMNKEELLKYLETG
jgi:uncharacterized protein (DUF3084 family)